MVKLGTKCRRCFDYFTYYAPEPLYTGSLICNECFEDDIRVQTAYKFEQLHKERYGE